MVFDADSDNETLPPGVVSPEARQRMLDVTGTQPTDKVLDKQADIRAKAFTNVSTTSNGKPRTRWSHTEIKRLATDGQWQYGLQHGHLDIGTTVAVGNLLLRGMSVSAVRKALGITNNTWHTWYAKGTDDDMPQSPYDVFAFVVDHSQAVMELRAVDGWTGQFDRDWRSAQAYLVARNPDEWNPTSKSTIDTTTKVDIDVTRHSDQASLLEVAAILTRANALPKAVATTSVTQVEVLQVESVEVPNDDDTGALSDNTE